MYVGLCLLDPCSGQGKQPINLYTIWKALSWGASQSYRTTGSSTRKCVLLFLPLTLMKDFVHARRWAGAAATVAETESAPSQTSQLGGTNQQVPHAPSHLLPRVLHTAGAQ